MNCGWPGTGMSHVGSKLRASKSEFWLARHKDEPLRLELTSIGKVSSGWPGTGMSHIGSKLRASQREFGYAKAKDERFRTKWSPQGEGNNRLNRVGCNEWPWRDFVDLRPRRPSSCFVVLIVASSVPLPLLSFWWVAFVVAVVVVERLCVL